MAKKNINKWKKYNGMTVSELLVYKNLAHPQTKNKVLRNGWPDFLVVGNGTIFAVEVKNDYDPVTEAQKQIHQILESVGIPVWIVREGFCKEMNWKAYTKSQLKTFKAMSPDQIKSFFKFE